MTGLCGIIHFDGRPVEPDTLRDVARFTAPAGYTTGGEWIEAGAGFGFRILPVTPQARYEELPVRDPSGRFVFLSTARIDNRRDLLHDLGIPGREEPTTSDAQLLAAAFLRWGRSFPDRILGDWAGVVWDRQERRLFLARDHIGLANLTYYRHKQYFAFATTLPGLLACRWIPRRLNELFLAKTLVSWPVNDGATVYDDIQRLEPGHTLEVTERGVTRQRYWTLADAPDVRFSGDDEYREAFAHLYSRAVRDRLVSQGPVGATLSGGLDSGSVCALAARELEAQGRTLDAFTSVPAYPLPHDLPATRFGDERPFAEMVASMAGNTRLTAIDAKERTPLDGIRRWNEIHGEPIHAASNAFWMIELFKEAQERGIRVLLLGETGNATVSWSGRGLFQSLLRDFRWMEVLREMLAQRSSLGRSIPRAVAGEILRPLVWAPLSGAMASDQLYARAVRRSSAIRPEFAQRLDLYRRMKEAGHDPRVPLRGTDRQLRLRLMLQARTLFGSVLSQQGSANGLEIRDPTRDKRLMEFCLGLPPDQFLRRGQRRRLIRRAMRGLMPDRVLDASGKGLQAADLVPRLRSCAEETEDILSRLGQDPATRRILDIPRMEGVVHRIKRGNDMDLFRDSVIILTRGLGVGLAVMHAESREASWTARH
jgi:asparagine synthase (glutamine-hydrolysing)